MMQLGSYLIAMLLVLPNSGAAIANDENKSKISIFANGAYQTAQNSSIQKRGIRVEPRMETTTRPDKGSPSKSEIPVNGDAKSFEIAVWNTVKASNDPSDFDAYLKIFPNGRFASQANKKLQSILEESHASATSLESRNSNVAIGSIVPQIPERNMHLGHVDRTLIQRSLNAMKYGAGPEDGQFGDKTRAAIRRYQLAMETKVSGYLTIDEANVLIELGRNITDSLSVSPSASTRNTNSKSEQNSPCITKKMAPTTAYFSEKSNPSSTEELPNRAEWTGSSNCAFAG